MKLRRIDENGVYWFGVPCRNDETLSCYNELETFIEMGFSGSFFLNGILQGKTVHQGQYSISHFAERLLFDNTTPNGSKLKNAALYLTDGKRTSQKNVSYFSKVGKLVLSFNSPESPKKGFEIILQVNDQIKVQMADKTLLTLTPAIDKKIDDSFAIHLFNEETGSGNLYKLQFSEFLRQFMFDVTSNCQTDDFVIAFDFAKHEVQEYQTAYEPQTHEYLNFNLMICYKGEQFKIKSNDFFFSIRCRTIGKASMPHKAHLVFSSFQK